MRKGIEELARLGSQPLALGELEEIARRLAPARANYLLRQITRKVSNYLDIYLLAHSVKGEPIHPTRIRRTMQGLDPSASRVLYTYLDTLEIDIFESGYAEHELVK